MPRKHVRHSVGREFYDDCYDDNSDDEEADNCLDFTRLTFYGRSEELQLLHSTYNRACNPDAKPKHIPLNLISGFSGTGKSALVEKFVDEVNEKAIRREGVPCFALLGKYNELHREDPFSAFVEALTDFSHDLLNGDQATLESVRKDVKKNLNDDAIQVLLTVVPALKDVIGTDQTTCSFSSNHAWNRVKYVFQTFIDTISTKSHPVIMFLDDLQWVDDASLELIKSLLTDRKIRHVMFIGAYRSTEVDEDHILSKSFEFIRKTRKTRRMYLLNLSQKEISDCICDLLELNSEEVKPLTDVLYSKTRGNMFFALQMLEEFQRRNILFFNKISFQWDWNLKVIDEMEAAGEKCADNVADVVVNKLNSTPKKLQKALIVAAHTRSKFNVDILQVLMQATGCTVGLMELIRLLDLAVLEGMLTNVMGSKVYKFAHDRIQKAAYSLAPKGPKKDQMCEKIGLVLFEMGLQARTDSSTVDDSTFCSSNRNKSDWMLFIAADHLNKINPHHRDPLLMTRLNVEVGERALKIAAFTSASGYLNQGMKSLSRIQNYWKKHHDIALRLHRALADVELILGNFEIGDKYAQQVLDQANEVSAALPTFMSLGLALGRQELHAEALDLYWDALALLGETRKSFPLPQLLWDLGCVTRYFKNHTDEDVLSLPIMENPTKIAAMRFYSEAAHQAFYCGNTTEWMLITLRRIRMSFKHGLTGPTALAFAHFATVMGSTKDQKSALRVNGLAKKIIAKTKATDLECQTLVCTTLLTDSWSDPPEETIQTLQHAEKVGMATGDIEFSFIATVSAIGHSFLVGRPLDQLKSEAKHLVEQLDLYNVDCIQDEGVKVIYYLADSDSEIDWEGLDSFGPVSNSRDETYRLLYGYQTRLALCVYFGNFEFAAKWIDGIKKVSTHDTACETVTLRTYFAGLSYVGLARIAGGSGKYVSLAKKEIAEMKRLIKARHFPTNHRYLIMDAALMAVTGGGSNATFSKVKDAFDAAIDAAIKCNHNHDAALCYELAGQFFMDRNEKNLGFDYFTGARNLYHEWDARAKVKDLHDKWGTDIESSHFMVDNNGCGDHSQTCTTFADFPIENDGPKPKMRVSCTSLPHELERITNELKNIDLDGTESKTLCTEASLSGKTV